MIQLTKEQYDKLTEFKSYLYSAYYADYIRCLSQREADVLLSISMELGFPKTNLSCGACRLNLCKSLGRIYYNQDNNFEEEEVKEEVKTKKNKLKLFKKNG